MTSRPIQKNTHLIDRSVSASQSVFIRPRHTMQENPIRKWEDRRGGQLINAVYTTDDDDGLDHRCKKRSY